jgi:hypothetical protein
LQEDLNKVLSWNNSWGLPLNKNKCVVLHIGKKKINVVWLINRQAKNSESDGNTFYHHDPMQRARRWSKVI